MRQLSDMNVTISDGWQKNCKRRLMQLEAMTKEGLTSKEIALKLGRTLAAVRNLRYKKHLVIKVQDETKALFQQRDELQNTVKNLGAQKNTLVFQVDGLRKEQERLQGIIALDEFLLSRPKPSSNESETPETRLVHNKRTRANS
jgi:uncharacterized protein (DUF3084 family)